MKPKSVRMTSTEKEPRSTKSPLKICHQVEDNDPRAPGVSPDVPKPPRSLPPPRGCGYVRIGLGGEPVELEDVQQVVELPVGVTAHCHLLCLHAGDTRGWHR